jgi:hypothetical protein
MRGIKIQMKYIRLAALTEAAFLIITAGIIIAKAPDNTIQVFNPFAWTKIYGAEFSSI